MGRAGVELFIREGVTVAAVDIDADGLAALAGDRPGAVTAYQHYLALRSNPEPSLRPKVEAVRAELTKLADRP